MWVDVESDKKDAMSESAFKAFKNRIKKLKVKDFVKCGIYQPFSPDEPTEWIWIEITSILENGLYMGIASNENCYESNIQLHDRCSLKARSINDLRQSSERGIFATRDLKAYFKFNEPSSSFGNNAIVLDSSGNSLHSTITNYVVLNRETGSFPVALKSESRKFNPVLFPKFGQVVSLNENLLFSAS